MGASAAPAVAGGLSPHEQANCGVPPPPTATNGGAPLPAAAAVHRALQSLIANGLVASHRKPPSLPPEGLALREEYQARSPGAAAAARAAAAAGPYAPQHRAPPGLPAGIELPPRVVRR